MDFRSFTLYSLKVIELRIREGKKGYFCCQLDPSIDPRLPFPQRTLVNTFALQLGAVKIWCRGIAGSTSHCCHNSAPVYINQFDNSKR